MGDWGGVAFGENMDTAEMEMVEVGRDLEYSSWGFA